MTNLPTERPRFTGAKLYNDPDRLFSFWYPHTWHVIVPEGSRGLVILTPTSDSIATSFSVEVRDLGMMVTPKDLPTLRQAVQEGLKQLGEHVILLFQTNELSDRFGFELRYTFRVEDTWRKRRAMLYYSGSLQYSMIAQGATIEEFDYWAAMFGYMMITCTAGGFDLRVWADEQQSS